MHASHILKFQFLGSDSVSFSDAFINRFLKEEINTEKLTSILVHCAVATCEEQQKQDSDVLMIFDELNMQNC